MAMIKCKECNQEMSEQAEKCPKCGCPNVPKTKCPECGESIYMNANVCPNCGYKLGKGSSNPNGKSKIAAGILGILVGSLGVHNFYLGYTSKAVTQLLMTILSCGILSVVTGVWGLVEGIMILTGSIDTDANGNPLAN